MEFPAGINARAIDAVQDMDCLDRVKFRYNLPFGLPIAARNAFPADEVHYYAFSTFVPDGKDLLTVIRPKHFRLDGIISAAHLIVSFDAPANNWPHGDMIQIEQILFGLGYRDVRYRRGENQKCSSCRFGHLTDCHGRFFRD